MDATLEAMRRDLARFENAWTAFERTLDRPSRTAYRRRFCHAWTMMAEIDRSPTPERIRATGRRVRGLMNRCLRDLEAHVPPASLSASALPGLN